MISEAVQVREKVVPLRKLHKSLLKAHDVAGAREVRAAIQGLLSGNMDPSSVSKTTHGLLTAEPEFVQWAESEFADACQSKAEVLSRISPRFKAKKYVAETVAKLGAFCDQYKFLPHLSIIRVSTVGGAMFRIFKSQTVVSRLLKEAEKIGLVKTVDQSYSNTQHYVKTRLLNKNVLHFCMELVADFNINPANNELLQRARFVRNYVEGEESYDQSTEEAEKFDADFVDNTFNVDFSAGLRVAGCSDKQALALVHAKYPQLMETQKIIDEDNLSLPTECQVSFRPNITRSKSGFITKIGIRACSPFCGYPSRTKALELKKDVSKFNGVWREDYVRDHFLKNGVTQFCEYDVSASIYTLNYFKQTGEWVDGDTYELMFGGRLSSDRRNLYKHNFSMQGMFDWSARSIYAKLSEYLVRFNNAHSDLSRVEDGRVVTYAEQLITHYRDRLQTLMNNSNKSTSIFLDESCVYAIVAHVLRQHGYDVLQVYDCFWVGKKDYYIDRDFVNDVVKKVAKWYFNKYYGQKK